MQVTVNSKIIAALNPLPVRLDPLLGSFALCFAFDGVIHKTDDGLYRWLEVESAAVVLRDKSGSLVRMEQARPDRSALIRQADNVGHVDFVLKLLLLPHQIALLERARDGGDLSFTLGLLMRGSDSTRFPSEWPEQAEVTMTVPQSAWIAQLNAAKADHILLFELKLPWDAAGGQDGAQRHLLRAHHLLQAGHWRQCVAECRQFAEAYGGAGLADAFNQLAGDRKMMDKAARETAMLAALQHYAHLASHAENRQGEMGFDRRDALLALSVAVALYNKGRDA